VVPVAGGSDDPRVALPLRLRELRQHQWPGLAIKQTDLAEALGVGGPSVSSWESLRQPKFPTPERLARYAEFFATERSVASKPYRIVQLAGDERERRDDLLRELTELLEQAVGPAAAQEVPAHPASMSRGLWYFPDGANVTIVCARLPTTLSEGMQYADPNDPDYSELYTFADPDALIELFGHIRAANPTSEVTFRPASELTADEYQTHLVLLGGVDWNVVTRDVLARFDLPVGQFRREDDDTAGGFEVTENGERQKFMAVLENATGARELVEDIAHFFRAPSPYDQNRTITVCNGTYSRGVYGAVRALTDATVRDENEAYVLERFAGAATFSILTKVIIVNGVTITPHWNVAESRLHEWPVA
jgi:transcriptional regulator with XRE-family HTH domain